MRSQRERERERVRADFILRSARSTPKQNFRFHVSFLCFLLHLLSHSLCSLLLLSAAALCSLLSALCPHLSPHAAEAGVGVRCRAVVCCQGDSVGAAAVVDAVAVAVAAAVTLPPCSDAVAVAIDLLLIHRPLLRHTRCCHYSRCGGSCGTTHGYCMHCILLLLHVTTSCCCCCLPAVTFFS